MSSEGLTPGQQLAAMRKRSNRPCAVCGKIMSQALGKRRYCSESCHSKAYRQRQKATVRPPPNTG